MPEEIPPRPAPRLGRTRAPGWRLRVAKRSLRKVINVYNLLYGSDGRKGSTRVRVLRTFPMFVPFSAGGYPARARLTIQAINQTIPLLAAVGRAVGTVRTVVSGIRDFPAGRDDLEAAAELKSCLDAHGSDKANQNDYHYLYGPILRDRAAISSVLEIGLGTYNDDIVSHMGADGRPGASLRAFRDFLPNAHIYGADVDARILFREQRIDTFFVDQTDLSSFADLERAVPAMLDLVIDDGLHSPNANLATLRFGLAKIRVGGWVVIEDISAAALPVWEIVAALLPDSHRSYILQAQSTIVFAVRRLR